MTELTVQLNKAESREKVAGFGEEPTTAGRRAPDGPAATNGMLSARIE